MKSLLLFGATGLVGGHALRLALADPRIGRVTVPTRRPLPAAERSHNPIVDFDALPADAAWWQADAAICALGTTLRKAGSQAAFRRVDVDYVVAAATLARRHGTPSFALNSSLGADANAGSFYLRCKGEAEDAVRACGFDSLTLVRPSLIGGDRAESRPMERVGLVLGQALRPLIPTRYRVVAAEDIAHCLLESAIAARPGEHVVESEAIAAEAHRN